MNSENKESIADTDETSATVNGLLLLSDEFDSFYEEFFLRKEFRSVIQKRHFKNYDSDSW
jgi:hypothetical protein